MDITSAAEGINQNERRIVLIGKTGFGKSATGNTLLGRKVFKSSAFGRSITKECKRETATRFGKELLVVDTPGLFDTDDSDEITAKEITKFFALTSPGPHVILLVCQIRRFTKEDQQVFQRFSDIFGKMLYDFIFVVFTRADDLTRTESKFEDFIDELPDQQKAFLKKCGNRCMPIDNVSPDSENNAETFINNIDEFIQKNKDACYTHEIYKAAEEEFAVRMKAIRDDAEHTKRKETTYFKKSIEQKYSKRESDLKHVKDDADSKLAKLMEEKELKKKLDSVEEEYVKSTQPANLRSQVRDELERNESILKMFLNVLKDLLWKH